MKTMIRHLTLLLVLGFAFLPAGAPAQTTSAPDEDNLQAILDLMRSDTNPFKIRTINRVMALTGPEAEKFWPIYQQYEKELGALNERGMAFIRDFLELQAGKAVNEQRWHELAGKWLKLKQDRLALWAKYQKNISKAISPYRAAQFLQVEHQMALFTDLSIAAEMPVISTQPAVAEGTPAQAVPTREETVLTHITATVEDIDYDKREVTLKGPLGNSVTFTVDQRVKRLKATRLPQIIMFPLPPSFALPRPRRRPIPW